MNLKAHFGDVLASKQTNLFTKKETQAFNLLLFLAGAIGVLPKQVEARESCLYVQDGNDNWPSGSFVDGAQEKLQNNHS